MKIFERITEHIGFTEMSGAESASDVSSDGDVSQFYRPGKLKPSFVLCCWLEIEKNLPLTVSHQHPSQFSPIAFTPLSLQCSTQEPLASLDTSIFHRGNTGFS